MFCNQDWVYVSKDVKISLYFDDNDADVSFLPMYFLDKASTMHVDDSMFEAYRLDEFFVEKKTVFRRDCRIYQILEELKALYLKNKSGQSETNLITREVVKLSEEIKENMEVKQRWKTRAKDVEKRRLNYCNKRLTSRNR